MKIKNKKFDKFHQTLVLFATGFVTAMGFIDITALNVALPFIQSSLGASATDIHWVLEIYLLFLAALTLVGGSLGDRWGRRRPLRWGIVVFGITSIGCATSNSAELLIFFRAIQGIGAAIMIPASLALINSSFPPECRGLAIGKWSAIVAITIPLGPIVGGLAVDFFSWHFVFIINIPICFIALLILLFIPRPTYEPNKSIPLDLIGSIIITIALGLITFSLLEAGRDGNFSKTQLVILLIGFLFLIVFFIVESKIENPMFPTSLLKNRRFILVTSQTFIMFAAFQSAMYFLAFLYIQSFDYSAFQAGAATLPISVIVGFFSRYSGKYVSKHGPQGILFFSCFFMMLGLITLSFSNENYLTSIFPGILFLGISVVLFAAPLTTVAMVSAGPERDGLASGISNAVSRIGPLLAVAFYGYWIGYDYSENLKIFLKTNPLPEHVKLQIWNSRDMLAATIIDENLTYELKQFLSLEIKILFANSIRDILRISAFLAIIAGFIALFYKPEDSKINE